MKDSGVSLYLPFLERDFDADDLHFSNAYMEILTVGELKPASEIGCSQVLFWGDTTKGTLRLQVSYLQERT